ncbi:MAG TPA: hypothetical protein VIF15_15310 [Polyangiaceae bacterium]
MNLAFRGFLSLPARLARAPTRWDGRLFARAAVVAALALAVGWLVTAATDEGGIGWGERAGRTLPLTPVCAAIGAWVALAPVRARGEARALAALGRSRAQIAAAAVAGAALVALAAALAIGALVRVDVAGFFPTATRASAWGWEGGAFVDRAQGLRVGQDGAPARLVAEGMASLAAIPPHGRAAAAAATALAGIALPLLLAHALLGRSPEGVWGPRDRRLTREDAAAALAAGAAIAGSVLLFQAAAARQAPALLGALPPLALLAFAVRRYRAAP